MMKVKRKNKRRLLIAGFIAAFIILYIIIYIVPQVSDIFVKTYSAEYGTLEIKEKCDYLAVRDEKVHTSDNSGKVERVISAGSLMRRNSHIVTVGGTQYYSQTRGIISYFYDGLETVYTPDKLDKLTAENIKAFEEDKQHSVKDCVKGNAQPSDPIFKVVDNKEWYLVFWLNAKQAEGIKEGAEVKVEFDDGAQILMDVKSIDYQKGAAKVVLVCDRYYKKYARIRTGSCNIIKSQKSGIILENNSIVENEGKKGVYVLNKIGNLNFVPVQILSSNEEYTVVTADIFLDAEGNTVETVETYQEILKDPLNENQADEIASNNKKGSE